MELTNMILTFLVPPLILIAAILLISLLWFWLKSSGRTESTGVCGMANMFSHRMKWKLVRINWHSYGNCWTWCRIKKFEFYRGNQVQIVWGRIALVFEKRVWDSRPGSVSALLTEAYLRYKR